MSIKHYSTPGVYRNETDLSNYLSPSSTSVGATVIRSKKGPIARPVLLTSNQDYIDNFGYPVFTSGTSSADTNTPEFGYGSYASLEFLKESNALYVVRDYDDGDNFASVVFLPSGSTSATSATGIPATADPNVADKIDSIYTLNTYSDISGKSLLIGAVGPGTDGNNTAVTVQTFSSACDWFNSYDNYTSAVSPSADIINHPIASQVFKINVYRKSDTEVWSNIVLSAITPVETFYGSRTALQDSNKNQLLISEVVNGNSQYIYVVPGTTNFTSASSLSATPSSLIPLSGGSFVYGTNIGSTDGWSYFADKEKIRVNILICPDYTMSVKQYVNNIAGTRGDCFAVFQTGKLTDTSVAQVMNSEKYGYAYPSFSSTYAGWTQIYDDYNDKKVWIPNAIIAAKLMARTDRIANIWDAPAGTQYGIVGGLNQNVRFSFNQIGQLYDVNINSVRNMQVGDVMWGQKTLQLKKSALDRINVRRLLLFIENSIESMLSDFTFQPNNESTRLRIYNIVDSFLATIKSGGGFNDLNGSPGYTVVCDETNNTPIVIDNNTLKVDISVNPVRTTEFIEFGVTITNSGVSVQVA